MVRRNNDATVAVLRYMRGKPGQIIHYSDVAGDLQMDEKNVNAVLARVVSKHPEYGMDRKGSGQYVFDPSKVLVLPKTESTKPTIVGSMYEGVGVTKDGTRIVRDEDGTIWKLSERL